MPEAGTRRRSRPAPPHVVAEALAEPDRDPARPSLELRASIRFDLAADGTGGTDLRWTLLVDEPIPEAGRLGHLRKRIDQLISASLRYLSGQ
jgi:hypothetical protein